MKRSLTKILALISCVSALAFCQCTHSIAGNGGGSTTTDNASVTGQAFYATGLPAKGAFVRIRPSTYVRAIGLEPDSITRHDTTVSDSGWYHIDSLKTGEYRIEINDNTSSAAVLTCDIVTKKDSLVLPPDTLATYQTITGIVDSALVGRPDLYVQVIGLDRIERVDSVTGAFVIADLAPGTYSIRVISADTSVKPIVIDTVKTDTTAGLSAVGFWTPSTGPYGGAFKGIAIGPQNTIFAGSQNFGIYRSTDNGATWAQANTGVPTQGSGLSFPSLFSLAVIDSTVLASFPGYGVYLSNDLGNHWTASGPLGFAGNSPNSFVIAGSRIFGVGSAGLYVSIDKGVTWTEINTSTLTGSLSAAAIGPAGTDLFVGTADGIIFRSLDSGATWAQIIRFPYPGVHGFAIRGANFVAATGSGIEISQDSGVTWTQTGTTVEFDMLVPGAGSADLYAFYGDLGVYRSADNGSTWAEATSALRLKYGFMTPTALAAGPNGSGGTTVFASTQAHGVIMSNDNGASWSETNNGLLASVIAAVGAVQNGLGGSNVLAADEAGTFISVNSGTGWAWLPDGTAAFYNGFLANAFAATFGGGQTTVFAGTATGVYVSTLSGSSPWVPANTGMADSNVLAIAAYRNTVFASTLYGGIFMSSDNGASWTARNTGLIDLHVNAFAVDSAAAGCLIFAGTDTLGVFLSADSGAHWTAANTGITNRQIRSLSVGPTRKGGHRLYAGTYAGVLASSDSGRTWSAVSHPSVGTAIVLCLLACSDNQGGSLVFAGNPDGLYVSIDNGATWSLVGLAGGCAIESLAPGLDGTGGRCLFAGTAGGGVWRLGLK